MNAWHRFWYGPVSAARPELLMRFVLAVLSLDCWLNLASHGARYGVADFNVAHFPWLDVLPTAGLYVGLVTYAGVLAAVQALHRPHRLGLGLVFVSYTLAWACSMLDSYQHHYLLSLVLLCFVFFPIRIDQRKTIDERSTHAKDANLDSDALPNQLDVAPSRVSAPAYVATAVTCAIVYFYTAVSKLDPDWRAGQALRRLIRDKRGQEIAASLGVDVDVLWPTLATGAIAVQLVTSVGYLLAVGQDRAIGAPGLRRWTTWLIAALAIAPLSFHLGTEWIGLRIGWFSYYMIGITLIFFAPAPWVETAVGMLRIPERWLRTVFRRVSKFTARPTDELPSGYAKQAAAFYSSLPILVTAAMTSSLVDIPGAKTATALAALAVVVMMGLDLYSRRASDSLLRSSAFAGACLALLIVATFGSVRFDYYRWGGGDHRTREDYVTALHMYEKANRYAPRGRDRKARENEMRNKLRELGSEP